MADIIPPTPVGGQFGSYTWQDWYNKVRIAINNGASIAWAQITDFTGSNLTQIATRSHSSLQNILPAGAEGHAPTGGATGTFLKKASNTTYDYTWSAVTGFLPLTGGTMSGAVDGITDLTTTGNTILGNAVGDTLNVAGGSLRVDASGNIGVGVAPSGTFLFELLKAGAPHMVLRSSTNNSYTSHRLYNDQNSGSRALEIDYSGSAYAGALIGGAAAPSGEQGAIVTTGAFPLSLGTNNTMRFTISGAGNIGFFGSIGAAQPTTAGASATRVAGATTALVTDTYDGYTLAQVVKALRNLGLLA